jgi:ankyrin repeat protein
MNDEGNTAIFSERCREQDYYELLFDRGASIHVSNKKGQTPLHYAIQHYNMPLSNFLIDKGASVTAKDHKGYTPLHVLMRIHVESDSVLKNLMAHGADLNAPINDGSTPLHLAVKYYNMYYVIKLVDLKANCNSPDNIGNTPVHIAIQRGFTPALHFLLSRGGNPSFRNKHGNAPLHVASRYGHVDCMEVLLKHKADPNIKDHEQRTPIFNTIDDEEANMDALNFLMHNGADLNVKDVLGRPPLHHTNDLEAIEALLDHGAEADVKDNSGNSLVHNILRQNGDPIETLTLLTDHEVDLECVNDDKETLLHLCASEDHLECASYLLEEADLDPNAQDSRGNTALHRSVMSDECLCLELLVDHGVTIDIQNNDGETPLHLAIKTGQIPQSYILLHNNARWDLPNREGKTVPQCTEAFDRLVETHAKKSNDGISYLFFANFLQFLTNLFGQVKWNHPCFQTIISTSLVKYFKGLQADFDPETVAGWYTELYG